MSCTLGVMNWQVYDYNTLQVLDTLAEPTHRYHPSQRAVWVRDMFNGLKARYGEHATARIECDPVEFGYRHPTEADLVPGFECLMVDDPQDYIGCGHIHGTTVRIDKVEDFDFGADSIGVVKMVYYHCISPKWDAQCFTSLNDFLNKPGNRCGGPETRYWVKK
jgi:hypothetical protein